MITAGAVDDVASVLVALGSVHAPHAGLSRTAEATLARLHRHGPTRLTELAVAEGVSQPSMSTLVARLGTQGLVQRSGDPQDARVVVLSLTPAGEDVLAQRRADRADRVSRALAQLSRTDARRIANALPALTQLADVLRRPSRHHPSNGQHSNPRR